MRLISSGNRKLAHKEQRYSSDKTVLPVTLILRLFPADEDHGEGERHLQRGEADGRGRALAGLSAAGVLQPGFYSQFTDQYTGSDWKQLLKIAASHNNWLHMKRSSYFI